MNCGNLNPATVLVAFATSFRPQSLTKDSHEHKICAVWFKVKRYATGQPLPVSGCRTTIV